MCLKQQTDASARSSGSCRWHCAAGSRGQKTTFTGTLNAASVRRRRRAVPPRSCACPASECTTAPGSSPSVWCGMRDERRVHHGGMVVENVLDLDAVDVLAAADQHVLGAVDDEAESLPRRAARDRRSAPSRRRRSRPSPPACSSSRCTTFGPLRPQLADFADRQVSRSSSTIMIFRSQTGTAGRRMSGRDARSPRPNAWCRWPRSRSCPSRCRAPISGRSP